MSTTLRAGLQDGGHLLRADLVRQPQQHDVTAGAASAGRDILEAQVGAPRAGQVHGPQRLADVVDADHADQLHLGMNQQAPDQLRAAVSAAADDDGLESLHLVDCSRARRARPAAAASR